MRTIWHTRIINPDGSRKYLCGTKYNPALYSTIYRANSTCKKCLKIINTKRVFKSNKFDEIYELNEYDSFLSEGINELTFKDRKRMKQKIDMMIHDSMMKDIKFVADRMMFQITRFIDSYPEYRCTGTKVIKSRYPVPNVTIIRIYFEH